MSKWVLLEHKVYSSGSFDIHYDFLIENKLDCLTWKFSKIPLLNQVSVEILKQPNHRLIWLSREVFELSGNRGFVKRIDCGIFKNVSDGSDADCFKFILDGQILDGLFEISGNSCKLSKKN